MNQLVCELCGSTDILKDGGVFVCQQCGCKYSLEEAKKMMGVGTVDVSGSTVKIDSSSKLNNLYILARRAKDTDNNKDAIRYYHEIQVEDPNSWEAAFYSVYFTAMDCRIGGITTAALSIANCLDPVLQLILDHVPAEKQKEAYTEVLEEAMGGEMKLYTAAMNSCKDFSYSGALSDLKQRGTACLAAMQKAVMSTSSMLKDYDLALKLNGYAISCCEILDFFTEIKTALQSLNIKIRSERDKAEAEKRIAAYWAEHAEEKQRYEARLGEIDAELAQLQAESRKYSDRIDEVKKALKERLPEEQQVDQLEKEQFQLNMQKSQLGLFAGKQKRELQDKIDALNRQIEKLKAVANDRRNALKSEVDAKVAAIEEERRPIRERINSLSAEKKQITAELTKDR